MYIPGENRAIGAIPSAPMTDGNIGKEILRDYRHAARIFVDSSYRLSPKYGFLFYVEFDFNPAVSNISGTAQQEMGMIVKSVTLPKFTLDVKEHNAYNRKNFVQNRIKYDPVSIHFHDDQADTVRNFWYDYYSYYYRDPDYPDVTYSAMHKYQSRPTTSWGYTPRQASGYTGSGSNQQYQYIQAIRIYSLYQHNFSECELINPIITSFRHGEHANGENTNILEHEMSVQFETVKYLTGYVTENTVGGFIDLHYDLNPGTTGLADLRYQSGSGHDGINDLAQQEAGFQASYAAVNADGAAILASELNAASAATSAAISYYASGASGYTNAGGFNVPGFSNPSTTGSTPNGSVNPAQLQSPFGISFPATQYAQVGATLRNVGIAGLANGLQQQTINQLQNAALGGLAAGPFNLAAAIKNPGKFLTTVENMALGYGTSLVSNYVNSSIQSGINSVTGGIAQRLGIPVSDVNVGGLASYAYKQATGNYGLPLDYSGQNYLNSSISDVAIPDINGSTLSTTSTFVEGSGLNATVPAYDPAELMSTNISTLSDSFGQDLLAQSNAIDQWSGAVDIGSLGSSFL
jgi:hypothetical protein